ncbi:ABC transporter substrate-binding protein [Desulfosarcina cetonica]|uniref:ABC transporter substrate-binding protein n=1 Tax=Desulfosarcina cetonica TaxID=90730 RepID=UPI000AA14CF6|nr:ABC transporter substrate-binding protein [Desulfosarcina cetonica]
MEPSCRLFRLATGMALIFMAAALAAPLPATAQEKMAYRLKWLINASTAGDVVARQQGFFSREGLDVAVKAGGPERDAIRELELGYAQFGVASADQVIRALAKGAPVVVLAQLFQVNPLQWIYRPAEFTLTTVRDLAGRTVGVTYGGNDETIMRALLATAGMDKGQVKLASVRYDYTPFFQKAVPIWPVYRNTQGIFLADKLKANGEAVAFFDPSRHGIRFVANSVVSSQQMVDHHMDTVRRFTRALFGRLAGRHGPGQRGRDDCRHCRARPRYRQCGHAPSAGRYPSDDSTRPGHPHRPHRYGRLEADRSDHAGPTPNRQARCRRHLAATASGPIADSAGDTNSCLMDS